MAGTERTAAHSLSRLRRIAEKPYAYGFFAALRLFEASAGDKPGLGCSRHPADDSLRLGQAPSLAFAPSTLAGLKVVPSGRPPRLGQYFFGLFGPNGPLPLHLTEYARERIRNHDDPTFSAFADIFHHRLLSLFYRAWARVRPVTHWDRPRTDRFSMYVGAQAGIGMSGSRNRDQLPDRAKLFYSGRLANRTRNAEGLQAILSDYLGLTVRLEQFIPQWQELPDECQLRLGRSGPGNQMGLGAALGERIRLCQQKFRLHLGPLSPADYHSFQPGSSKLAELGAIIRNYCGEEMAWDLCLTLDSDRVPPLEFGKNSRIGFNSWLTSSAPTVAAESLTIKPEASNLSPSSSEMEQTHV